MTTDDDVQTDTCHWCKRQILLMDSGVWTTRWEPVGTQGAVHPGGINRCEAAPGVAKFHFPSSLAEKGDIVTDLPPGVVSLKEALERFFAELRGAWRASGYQAVMAALSPTEPLFPEGETRIRLPHLHNLEQPGHQPPQESTCTRCGNLIVESGHGLWVTKPTAWKSAWPGRCQNKPGQRHQPRDADLAPEGTGYRRQGGTLDAETGKVTMDGAEELDHVPNALATSVTTTGPYGHQPEDGDWYRSTCQHCDQTIWAASSSERWITQDGTTDCPSVVVDAEIHPAEPHVPTNPAATTYATCRHCHFGISRAGVTDAWQTTRTDECPAEPASPDEGVTVQDAIGRVNAGPEGDWLRGKLDDLGSENARIAFDQPRMTVTFPPGGTRFSGGPAPSDLPGLFHVEECDESDPAPGLRLMVGGSQVGRMSYPEAQKLALDILVKTRFRLAILEEQRGTHDGPHDLAHSHRPAAACLADSCPAFGTETLRWRNG
jgi:hypothetical protein